MYKVLWTSNCCKLIYFLLQSVQNRAVWLIIHVLHDDDNGDDDDDDDNDDDNTENNTFCARSLNVGYISTLVFSQSKPLYPGWWL